MSVSQYQQRILSVLIRVVSISLCSENGNILSGSLDRTVLLWDSRVEKAQGLLRVQGRPAVSYDDQGLVFAIAYGGYIRMFDARNFEKGPFDIFSVGNDDSEANVIKFSSDGRRLLLTTKAGRVHVLDSFHGNNIATYNVKPVVSNSTLEASFSPDGNHIISGDPLFSNILCDYLAHPLSLPNIYFSCRLW
jgi:COMPASS component SWD2